MITSPVQVERRAAQRFEYSLPLSVRRAGADQEVSGFVQNLSARGIFFYSDCALEPGAKVEITLMMPAEVTLSENMRVRCLGKVLRVNPPAPGGKTGMAVLLERYEYLSDTLPSVPANSTRVADRNPPSPPTLPSH